MALRARKVSEAFEKRVPGRQNDSFRDVICSGGLFNSPPIFLRVINWMPVVSGLIKLRF